jgi:hypothetical protein
MSKQLEIYEVEYSCSPGGVDKWEITEVGGNYFRGDFDNAQEAIAYALMEFEGQELNLNIKSLKWYHDNEQMMERLEEEKEMNKVWLINRENVESEYGKLSEEEWVELADEISGRVDNFIDDIMENVVYEIRERE